MAASSSSSLKFLSLPAEVRAIVYDHLLPDEITANLSEGDPNWDLITYTWHKNADAKFHSSNDSNAAKNAFALMRVCKFIGAEITPRCYHKLVVCCNGFPILNTWQRDLKPSVKSVITRLEVKNYACFRQRKHYEQALELRAVVQSFPGLRDLTVIGLDRTADEEAKGTAWKPRDLKMACTLMEQSSLLRKAYYDPTVRRLLRNKVNTVRLTLHNAVPRPNELEFDPSAELTAWEDNLEAKAWKRKIIAAGPNRKWMLLTEWDEMKATNRQPGATRVTRADMIAKTLREMNKPGNQWKARNCKRVDYGQPGDGASQET